ncbi:NADH dehydrogenase [ubiquinone] 1 alpha subcomplex assembly factor 3-like isoform X2 [Gigantopelta aegis]|nr:NADH dehydrogenase [ubiquinone] 1 alpha subcomplex assembly factor 3-like isoform X2 [Gigantopelta aegis]
MTIHMLSKEDDANIYIEAYSPEGFKLSSGFRILGPCAVFPRSILHWNVKSSKDIHENSLSLFCMLEPKIDILILGIGDHGSKYNFDIIRYLRSKKINVEILPTDQACSTFNFLNSERRYVAAALIPPQDVSFDIDEDLFVEDLQVEYTKELDTPGEFEEEYKYIKENFYSKLPGLKSQQTKPDDTKGKRETDDLVEPEKDKEKK